MKDPVGGVQPIEYMLQVPSEKPTTKPSSQPTKGTTAGRAAVIGPKRWLASDSMILPGMKSPPKSFPLASADSMKPNPRLMADDADTTKLRPLVTPLMMSHRAVLPLLPSRPHPSAEPLRGAETG
jgi:hypothetical protein